MAGARRTPLSSWCAVPLLAVFWGALLQGVPSAREGGAFVHMLPPPPGAAGAWSLVTSESVTAVLACPPLPQALLTACLKLFFKRAPECRQVCLSRFPNCSCLRWSLCSLHLEVLSA